MNALGKKPILVGAGLLYPLLVAAVLWRLAGPGLHPRLAVLAPGTLTALSLGLAVIALINVTTPWRMRGRWHAESQALAGSSADGLGSSRPLLLGLPFAAAPASYGLLLYFLGAPLAPALLLALVSLLAAASWGLAELREPGGA